MPGEGSRASSTAAQAPRSRQSGSRRTKAAGPAAKKKGQGGMVGRASDLSLEHKLTVIAEATELPPFGFHVYWLQERLKERLGFPVSHRAINECLSAYYNLREWQERFFENELPEDAEPFSIPDSLLQDVNLSQDSGDEDRRPAFGPQGNGSAGSAPSSEATGKAQSHGSAEGRASPRDHS